MPGKQEILINVTPQETRCALLRDGVLKELNLERTLGRGLVGNIYKGKVMRVLPGMQAAFVDIGEDRNGFLHAADLPLIDPDLAVNPQDTPSIEDRLHQGEHLWVQVIRDPIDDKGARLSTQLSIPSRHLVYLPSGSGIGISQKISSAGERQRLQTLLASLAEEQEITGGFIVRTLAESATDSDIVSDLMYLQQRWRNLRSVMQQAKSASKVYQDKPLVLRTIRDLAHKEVEQVTIDSSEAYAQAREFAQEYLPDLVEKIHHYTDPQPLFDSYAVEQEIQRAMKPQVSLISGGDLVIEQTTAMTTVDINTGAYVGKKDLQTTILKTNLEAAEEIAHQLRLRNVGGIIIVDFIDMSEDEHRQQVLAALRSALQRDRVKTQVSDMSALGLVEITRKRTRESLEQLLCESCAVCDGRGMVKTVQTICYEILREVTREAGQYQAQGYTIVASPAVIDLLLGAEANSLANLQETIARPIKLQAESHYHQQQYDIALN